MIGQPIAPGGRAYTAKDAAEEEARETTRIRREQAEREADMVQRRIEGLREEAATAQQVAIAERDSKIATMAAETEARRRQISTDMTLKEEDLRLTQQLLFIETQSRNKELQIQMDAKLTVLQADVAAARARGEPP